MVTRWSLARRVVFSRACTLRSDCVGALIMFAVSVRGMPKKLEFCVVLYASSRFWSVECELVEVLSSSGVSS